MALLDETRITLTTLARENNVNPATCWRWATRKSGGAKLETIVIGGRRLTSREAFARWVAARTEAANAALVRPAADHAPSPSSTDASAKLAAAGF